LDERLFTRLASLVETQPVVLASIVATRGAVPRRAGARMLVTREATELSVGGGLLESRVVDAARELLANPDATVTALSIDLTGRAGSAGVCGGTVSLALRRWHGDGDCARARELARTLQTGQRAVLAAHESGHDVAATLVPDERLLIVGAGHCAHALYELARHLEYEIVVYDRRQECFAEAQFASAIRLVGPPSELARALDTPREVHAVLLNRDFASDIAALEVLCTRPPALMTMMGSRKRIAEVTAALPHHAAALERLVAPCGIEIDAETPHEIAVSILAQLVAFRRSRVGSG